MTVGNPAPSLTDAASSLRVGAMGGDGAPCSAGEAQSNRRAQGRVEGRTASWSAPVEVLRGTARRTNALTAGRMVIWVIALIVG